MGNWYKHIYKHNPVFQSLKMRNMHMLSDMSLPSSVTWYPCQVFYMQLQHMHTITIQQIVWVPSGKLTQQWNVPIFNRKYIFQWSILHFYVSLPECRRTGWLIGGGARNMPARTEALYFGKPSKPVFCRNKNGAWFIFQLFKVAQGKIVVVFWGVWSTLIPPLSLSPTFMQMAQHRNCQPKRPNCQFLKL